MKKEMAREKLNDLFIELWDICYENGKIDNVCEFAHEKLPADIAPMVSDTFKESLDILAGAGNVLDQGDQTIREKIRELDDRIDFLEESAALVLENLPDGETRRLHAAALMARGVMLKAKEILDELV